MKNKLVLLFVGLFMFTLTLQAALAAPGDLLMSDFGNETPVTLRWQDGGFAYVDEELDPGEGSLVAAQNETFSDKATGEWLFKFDFYDDGTAFTSGQYMHFGFWDGTHTTGHTYSTFGIGGCNQRFTDYSLYSDDCGKNATSRSTGWHNVTMLLNFSATPDITTIWIDGVQETTDTSLPSGGWDSITWKSTLPAGATGFVVDNVMICDTYCPDVEPPPAPPSYDDFITESAFSEQFENTISIGNSYGTVESVNFEVTESVQQTYYTSTITTSANSASTAECRINLGGQFYGSTATRSLGAGSIGNFRLATENVTLAPANYTVSTECRKTGGANYDVIGTTLSGHLLYDVNRDLNITYAHHSTTTLTTPASYSPIYNYTFSTGQNWNATSTNALSLLSNWRSTATYAGAGNISIRVEIDGQPCANYTRYGSAGSVGSIAGACLKTGFVNGTDYIITMYAEGDGTVETHFNTKELIQHNTTTNSTLTTEIPVTSDSLTAVSNIILSNVLGGTFNVFMEAGVNAQTNDTSTTGYYALKETTTFRNNTRTFSTIGQPGNVLVEAITSAAGSGNINISLMGACANSDCLVNDGDLVVYVTDASLTSDNVFNVTAFDFYTGGTINTFNVTVGGATVNTTTGFVQVVTNDTNPVVLVNAQNYFTNTTVHDRSVNLNASLVQWTKVQANFASTPISNFSLRENVTNTNYTTSTGEIYLPLANQVYNLTLFNGTYGVINFSEEDATLTASPYIQFYNYTLYLSNTFNMSFVDEISLAYVAENVTLEIVSDIFAQNYTVTDTTQFNVSLLTPAEYTIRYRSTSYTERDYIIDLEDGTFNNLELFMITLNESSDVLVTVEDTGADRVENATVTLLRYFVGCNCYKTVEMSKTSPSGQAIFWVQATEGFYKWSVNYLSENKFLSTSPENIVTDTRVFTINLGSDFYESWQELDGMGTSFVYNQTTGAATFTWSDGSGLVTQGCLVASNVNGTKWSNIGPTCVTGATGSVILQLSNTTTYQYRAYVDTSTGFSEHTIYTGWLDNWNPAYDFGNLGAFMGGGVVIGLALLFSFSAVAVMIISVVGMIFLWFMGLLHFDVAFIVALASLTVGMAAFLMRR